MHKIGGEWGVGWGIEQEGKGLSAKSEEAMYAGNVKVLNCC